MTKMKNLCRALLLCALTASGAFAQDTTGVVEGGASDPSGAVVVGARVTARNLDTGFSKETAAASDGFYRLLLLPVGRYSVTVEAPQFAVKVLEPIQVNVSQTVQIGRASGRER